MKIYLGADHRGFELKEKLKAWLTESGYQVEDLGDHLLVPDDDYVDFAEAVAAKVSSEDSPENITRGILICGSGIGMSITANKFKNIRCSLGFDETQIEDGRSHDNVNILALAADQTQEEKAKSLVKKFLETPFTAIDKYKRRIEKIRQLD
jgi:ribose 5-phosphate isomerase B